MLVPAFSPFPTMFSTLSQREIIIFGMLNFLSANAFILDESKILSFVKELNEFSLYLTHTTLDAYVTIRV